MVYEGTAMWANITTPNTRFEPKYSIDLVVDNDTAQSLKKEGFNIKFDKEEGPTITIKRNVNGPNGMVRKAPKLLDNVLQLLIIFFLLAEPLQLHLFLIHPIF